MSIKFNNLFFLSNNLLLFFSVFAVPPEIRLSKTDSMRARDMGHQDTQQDKESLKSVKAFYAGKTILVSFFSPFSQKLPTILPFIDFRWDGIFRQGVD